MPLSEHTLFPKSRNFISSRLLSLLLLLWMSLYGPRCQVLAQDTPTEGFPHTPPLEAILNGNASFRLVLGRVILDTKRYKVGQFRFKTAEIADTLPADTLRTLTITLDQGQPNLALYRSTTTERWMIEARGNGRCKIQYTNSERAYSLIWDQPAAGAIKVHLEQNGQKQSFTGLSVWHFRFEEPDLCAEHLFPMLLKIEPNWNLELIAKETEKRMEEVLQIQPLVTERKIQELMQEFSSNNSSTRDKAHRELRSLGLAILTPLMSLDMDQLDLEQRLRVKRLIQTMKPMTDDTPNRLAAWLSGDYAICQRIASQLQGDAKKQGLAYLQGLSGIESGNIIR